jgi:hypothetical protein
MLRSQLLRVFLMRNITRRQEKAIVSVIGRSLTKSAGGIVKAAIITGRGLVCETLSLLHVGV